MLNLLANGYSSFLELCHLKCHWRLLFLYFHIKSASCIEYQMAFKPVTSQSTHCRSSSSKPSVINVLAVCTAVVLNLLLFASSSASCNLTCTIETPEPTSSIFDATEN